MVKSSIKTYLSAYRWLLPVAALLAMALPLAIVKTQKIHASVPHAPQVVVTIAPLHALVRAVMQGVGEPVLLLKPGESPHHYALKPKDAEAVTAADVVFAASEEQEYYLKPLLKAITGKGKPQAVYMERIEGMTLHPMRHADEHHDAEGGYDMHIWLDPLNAILFVRETAAVLSAQDTKNARIYAENAQKQIEKLQKLQRDIQALFPLPSKAAYLSYHDTLQYFESRYGITGGGRVLAQVPEAGPSVKEAEAVYVLASQLKCVLTETEFTSRFLNDLAAKFPHMQQRTLDALGTEFYAMPDAYEQSVRKVAEVLSQCVN